MRRILMIAIIVCASHHAWGATTAKDRRFVSARYGLSVDAPTDWTLSTHTGFPSILVLLLHPDGSRISIAVSETPAKSARELADSNRRGLEAQSLKIVGERAGARDGVEIEAQVAARAETVMQLYLLRALATAGSRQAIVVSLITPSASLASHRAAFDSVVAKLGFNPVAGAAAVSTPPRSTPPTQMPTPTSTAPPASAAERPAEKDRR